MALVKAYLNNRLKKIINYFGVDLVRFPSLENKNLLKLIYANEINAILDVGANVGQYALGLRKMGYRGRIISFEPLRSAYSKLKRHCDHDLNWDCFNYALGDVVEDVRIHVASNSASSSILAPLKQIDMLDNINFGSTELVSLKTLDSEWESFELLSSNVFLKMDTQGFEKNVLKGGQESLKNIKGIQIELSLVKIYENESLFDEMHDIIKRAGFELQGLIPNGYSNIDGRLMQFDGIYFRRFNDK